MEPTFKIGARVFGSSLIEPKVNDIISYYATPTFYEKTSDEYMAICRIVGKENDIIEIRNGTLYVNNIPEKDTLNLGYFFKIKNTDLNIQLSKYDQEKRSYQFSESEILLNFSYNELIKLNILNKCERYLDTITSIPNPNIFGYEYSNEKWTLDNFGPITVPKGNMFLLGDNRSNSADSKIRGFTKIEKVITKIIE